MRNNYEFTTTAVDPCRGCLSTNCRACPCSAEREDSNWYIEKAEARKVKKARGSSKTKPAAQPTCSSVPGFESFGVSCQFDLASEILGPYKNSAIFIADCNGMKNAGIFAGDYLVFTSDLSPEDGDIVIATVNGEHMCRRFFREGGGYRIRREDGITPDTITNDCVVHGVLVSVSRANRRSVISA